MAWRDMIDEFRQNPRLQLGLVASIGLVWFYGVLTIDDQLLVKSKELTDTLKRQQRWEQTAAQSEWMARANEAREAQKLLEKQIWREETLGLAQANFGDWLARTIVQAGLTRPQIAVSIQPVEGVPGDLGELWRVTARVNVDFDPKTLAVLLGKLSAEERLLVTETMTIRGSPVPKVDLQLLAYFGRPLR